jgi:predicted DNA binding protein
MITSEALPGFSGRASELVLCLSQCVEVLVAYSHSAQTSELRLCIQDASVNQRPRRRPVTRQAWSLNDRLSEAQLRAIVYAYVSGATAARLADTYGLSLSSLKRILRSAGATKIHIGS